MYKATYVSAELTDLISAGTRRPEIIKRIAPMCLGWPYVYAAAGEMCTPEWRRNRMRYSDEKYAAAIVEACPVLKGMRPNCDGCQWAEARCFDCRGFTRWVLGQAGITLAGGGATSQWGTASNWAATGAMDTLPRGLVCCLFKRKGEKMSHTGLYLGGGMRSAEFGMKDGFSIPHSEFRIIHCSTTVKEDRLPGVPAWTHWGIPAGMYTTDELRRAGVNVDESRNILTLRRGSAGDEVEELQALLNAKYGADLDVDGRYGAKTEAAVKAFQKAHGLTADGIVGAKTRKALGLQSSNSLEARQTARAADTVCFTVEDWLELRSAIAVAEDIVLKYEKGGVGK